MSRALHTRVRYYPRFRASTGGLGLRLLWIRGNNHRIFSTSLKVCLWFISPDSYLIFLPWCRWITYFFTLSVPLNSFRADISQLAPFGVDMLFEWEKVCLLFLYEFSWSLCLSVFPLVTGASNIFYGLAPQRVSLQRGHWGVMKGSI